MAGGPPPPPTAPKGHSIPGLRQKAKMEPRVRLKQLHWVKVRAPPHQWWGFGSESRTEVRLSEMLDAP